MTSEEFITILEEYANNTGDALLDLEEEEIRILKGLAYQLIEAIDAVLSEEEPVT